MDKIAIHNWLWVRGWAGLPAAGPRRGIVLNEDGAEERLHTRSAMSRFALLKDLGSVEVKGENLSAYQYNIYW